MTHHRRQPAREEFDEVKGAMNTQETGWWNIVVIVTAVFVVSL